VLIATISVCSIIWAACVAAYMIDQIERSNEEIWEYTKEDL
jgi:hypothetical protein